MVISTVFAGFGMIIYLQNVGNFPTYTAHTQIGMFSIAALLVGGASVEKASIKNVFLGVILFHTMFIVAPRTGTVITGSGREDHRRLDDRRILPRVCVLRGHHHRVGHV